MRWGAILGRGRLYYPPHSCLIDYTHWRDNRVINEKTAKIRSRRSTSSTPQRNANSALEPAGQPRDARRSQFLNGIIVRKSFSWTRAFSISRRSDADPRHLVKSSPELTPQNELKIKMTVEGKSRDKALDLVRKLETSNEFKKATIEDRDCEVW